MKLKVLVPGSYNDYNHRAEYLEAGSVFLTSDAYGNTLVIDGYCTKDLDLAVETPLAPTGNYSELIELGSKFQSDDNVDIELISKIGVFSILLEVNGVNEGMLKELVQHDFTSLEDFLQTDAQNIKRVLPESTLTLIRAMQKKARQHILESRGIS